MEDNKAITELTVASRLHSTLLSDMKDEVKTLTSEITKFRAEFHGLDKTVTTLTSSGFKEAIAELETRITELERFKYQFVGALVVAQLVWVAIFKFWK